MKVLDRNMANGAYTCHKNVPRQGTKNSSSSDRDDPPDPYINGNLKSSAILTYQWNHYQISWGRTLDAQILTFFGGLYQTVIYEKITWFFGPCFTLFYLPKWAPQSTYGFLGGAEPILAISMSLELSPRCPWQQGTSWRSDRGKGINLTHEVTSISSRRN